MQFELLVKAKASTGCVMFSSYRSGEYDGNKRSRSQRINGWALSITLRVVLSDPATKLAGGDAVFTFQDWNGGIRGRSISDERLSAYDESGPGCYLNN